MVSALAWQIEKRLNSLNLVKSDFIRPGIRWRGRGARKAFSSPGATIYSPLGFTTLVATLAMSLLVATDQTGSRLNIFLNAFLSLKAISTDGPKSLLLPVTSINIWPSDLPDSIKGLNVKLSFKRSFITSSYRLKLGGSGIKRFIIGSVTDRLVKILSCPLLVLQPSEGNLTALSDKGINLDKILVGYDFSEDSQLAFDYALGLAQEFQSQLYLAHVVRPVDKSSINISDPARSWEKGYPSWNMTDYMGLKKDVKIWEDQKKKSLFAKLEGQLLNMVPDECKNWCTPVTVLLEGSPYQELISYAQQKEIDMIVLGIHGHNLWEKFMVGSTTDRLISRAPCPVLAVRTPAELHDKKDAVLQEVEKDSMITARNIMETDVIKVSPDTDIISAAQILLENHINGVPVVDVEDRLQGVLCQSDLIFQQKKVSIPTIFSFLDGIIPLSSSKQLDKELQKIAALNVGQAMVKNPVAAHPDMPISEIASLMVEKHFHTIPVVEEGKLVGIVGKEDILKVLIPAG